MTANVLEAHTPISYFAPLLKPSESAFGKRAFPFKPGAFEPPTLNRWPGSHSLALGFLNIMTFHF